MKILAFAGSISDNSMNKKLIHYAATFFEEDQVEILDLNDYEMPFYKHEREATDGVPQKAYDFAAKIDGSDMIIMALAEYNSSYTAAFKNIFDWTSRVKDRKHFGEKPMFLLATAPGPGGGKNVVEAFQKRAPFSGAPILETFVLPKFRETFVEGQGIVDEEKLKEFKEKVTAVKAHFSK